MNNNSCGPGLYSILVLYWFMHSNNLCSLCDRLAMSFLSITTSDLWSVIMLTLWANQKWLNLSRLCNIPRTSLSVLLYWVSALAMLLLEILLTAVIGYFILWNCIPSHACRRLSLRPTSNASVSKYSSSFSL